MPLIESAWPTFDNEFDPLDFEPHLIARISQLNTLIAAQGYTHALIYGDREHCANLLSLTGFDPRFEEALLIVRPGETPLLLVGNECESYLPISPLFRSGKLR